MNWIVWVIVALYSGALLFAAWCAINLRTQLDKRTDELTMERAARRKVEEESLRVVEKVYPLIEQTDWMSGRWHGQYNTLVRMESRRNEAVVAARQALWKIPMVADYIKKNVTSGAHLTVSDQTKNYGAGK